MSGAKSKSPSPPRQESLSKTILAMPRDGWNQSMKNTCKTIAELGKKEAEKNMNLSTAMLIAQSFDTDSCESCLKKEDLRKLIQIFNEQEKTKNPAQDSPASGVDERLKTSTISEKKPQSPSPQGKESLSKTLSAMPKGGWNQSMRNTFMTIAHADKKEAEKNMRILAATFFVQSFNPDTCKSCLETEEQQTLLQAFYEQETTKNPAKDSPAGGVDERASSNKTQGPANAQELKKQEPVQGQKSLIATGGASSKKTHEPEKITNAPGLKKPEPGQGQKSDIATGRSDPANTKSLLEKRGEELIEREEEFNNLYKRIEEKDKTLEKLDGEVKKLKNDKKMMENELDKAKAEKDDRQSVVNCLEGLLEKSNFENTELRTKIKELLTEKEVLKEDRTKTANAIKKLMSEKSALEENIEKQKKYVEKVYRDNQKRLDEVIEDKEKEVRSLNNKLSEIIKERDDLKTRFSKLAGAKLTDQNADIADLSDPNRAMKVSEKFGQLYDDEWTDAFEELKKKKMDGKDAIKLLLHILQECHAFCNNLKEVQIDSLNNVLLHPSQDITKFANEHRKNVGGLKERPRISSKDEKAVRNLRRQIGVSNTCIEEVKQVFVLETKSWVDRGFDKKQLEVCKPYLEKCAEVCWLMVLHDPPLYMKMDASEGDKMDPNLYTVYSTSGDKIKYLVWPPLYNEAGGGLISKGVTECVKIIKKN